MGQRKYIIERREVAERIATRLRKHPDKRAKISYFQIRYFRSQWHEEEMLRNLYARVNEHLKSSDQLSVHVQRSHRGRLKAVSFKLGPN